jgi:uncharacterized protein (DUF58 family)
MRANRYFLLFLMFSLVIAGLATRRGDIVALVMPLLAYLGLAFGFAPPGTFQSPKKKKDFEAAGVADLEDEPAGADDGEGPGGKLSLTRTLSRANVKPAQLVEQPLALKNEGLALDEVLLTDRLPPGVSLVEGPAMTRMPLGAGETTVIAQTLRARRGEYEFPPAQVVINETFGLFFVQANLEAPARLSVEPESEVLRPFILRPPQTRGFAGPVPARQGGRGTDFFGVREYQSGDSLRHINWKASSRAVRALYTNIFEQQRIADVGIILDAREQVDLRNPEFGNLFEYSVRAAAALTEPILHAGNRLGLLVYGPGMESVFPGYGKVQQRRILRALARAGAGHNYALESLAHIPTRFFPAGSQIILISPLSPEDPPLVAYLATMGYGVLLISPNPLMYEQMARAETHLPDDIAWRLATAERHFHFQRMQRAGVRVVDWDVSQPLAPSLHVALRRRR